MSIPETIERWAARIRKPLDERIAALTQERDQLRAALLQIGRDADCVLRDEVSTDFLMYLPEEMRLQRHKLRAEVERLSAPVSDEQAEASFHAWNSVCSNSTRWNELEPGEQERWKAAMLAARRKP